MFAFVLIHYSMARARARIAPKSRSETHHPMKLLYAPVIVSLALFAGCAKNSDVAKLQSQLRKMQDQQLELTSDLQGKLDATQGRLAKVEADLKQAKTSASELKDTVNSNKETETTDAKTEADDAKAEMALDRRVMEVESQISVINPTLATKADALEFLDLQRKVALISARAEDAQDNNSALELLRLQDRVDDIVAALKMPDRQRRQWMIDVLH